MTATTQIQSNLKKAFIAIAVAVLILAFPANIVAAQSSDGSSDDSSASKTEEAEKPAEEKPQETKTKEAEKPVKQETKKSDTADKQTGPKKPTGDASKTYTFNKETGLWENGQYTWNPDTKQTAPKNEPTYSYNPATGRWDTTKYVYSPEQGKYVPNVVSTAQPPAGAKINGTGPNSNNQIYGQGSGNSINGTGSGSNNSINNNGTNNGFFDLFNNGSISNNINSNAVSGNASIQGNTNAGSALTGDAQAIANVVSLLQSSWLAQNGNLSGFTLDVGDFYGDLFIDPGALPYNAANNNIDVNIANNGAINNDINLNAASGNANVSGNTNAGDATTGDAAAIANLFNLINSAIVSGGSFVGTLNINGNFNGDILLPQSILDGLIATTGPGSNNQIDSSQDNNFDAEINSSKTINNNVNAEASSGDATVSGNTEAGSATTGTAETAVETINLIGDSITGKNGLLVFVNVLGSWLGLMLTPTNSSVANTGPDSNNTINSNGQNSVSVKADENSLINNNVNATASSGDATVNHNTTGGNATSGDAKVAVNVLNVIDSDINLEDWFGVLFINVFGQWDGSFGIDTASGNQPIASDNQANNAGNGTSNPPKVFSVASNTTGSSSNSNSATPFSNNRVDTQVSNDQNQHVAAASTSSPTPPKDQGTVGSVAASTNGNGFALPVWSIIGAIILIPLILFGERLIPLIRSRFGSV